MALTIDLPVPLSLSPAETVRYVQRIEALGFHGAGLPDHPEQGHDVFVLLALAAFNTSRIVLYPSVTNPVARHPHILANMANTLNEVAPGRIKLAIATGDSALRPIGRPPATLAEMRSAVSFIRGLLRGEAVRMEQGQEEFSIPVSGLPPPVVVVASRPRMTELAGEVGDEAMVMAGLEPRMMALAQRSLEAGARRVGRSLDGFCVSHYLLLCMDQDATAARERARGWLHLWLAQGQFSAALNEVGIDVPHFDQPEDISQEWLARLCDLLFVVGSPERCAERFQELAAQGVDHVACLIPGGPRVAERTIELMAEYVLPGLALDP